MGVFAGPYGPVRGPIGGANLGDRDESRAVWPRWPGVEPGGMLLPSLRRTEPGGPGRGKSYAAAESAWERGAI